MLRIKQYFLDDVKDDQYFLVTTFVDNDSVDKFVIKQLEIKIINRDQLGDLRDYAVIGETSKMKVLARRETFDNENKIRAISFYGIDNKEARKILRESISESFERFRIK